MRRRKSPIHILNTLVAVLAVVTPRAVADADRPTAIPFLPLAIEKPISVQYRVQRSAPLSPAPRAYAAPPIRPMSWTPSGTRAAGDLGTWTFTRDRYGRWNSEFAMARPGSADPHAEWRYRAESTSDGVRVTAVGDEFGDDRPFGPPEEFVSSLSRSALPFLVSAPNDPGADSAPILLSDFLSSLDAADAEPTERGWQIQADIPRANTTLLVEADAEGTLLRIEKSTIRQRHDGPVLREVIDVEESRIIGGSQMPWRLVRTVYEGARVWERMEYEVIEAIPTDRQVDQASLN